MKKSILKSALLAVAGIGLMAGGALADLVPDSLEPGFSWTDADYWTLTDLNSGQGTFELAWERDIDRDWNFGIYTLSDDGLSVANTFELFNYLDDPANTFSGTKSSVYLSSATGSWRVGDTMAAANDDTSVDNLFGTTFGFYVQTVVPAGANPGPSDNDAGYFYADYELAGSVEEHIFIAQGGNHDTMIYFNQGAGSGNWEQIVMTDDIDPVPEPATMLLFGTGLAGLAGFSRKRKKSQNA